MAKFDLKGMLSERSAQEMDLPEQKTVYRNPEDLIPSKDNFYSTEDTEKLKQSIKVLGILQPLLIEERDGKDYALLQKISEEKAVENGKALPQTKQEEEN